MIELHMKNKFYVYSYLRADGSPYYIGKGTGYRAWSPTHSVSRPSDKSKIVIMHDNLSEEEAFELEIKLISEYGRKDLGTGILRNQTDGGEGGTGYWHQENIEKYLSFKARLNRPQRRPITQREIDEPIDYDSPLTKYQAAHLEWSRELALKSRKNKKCVN